MTMRSFTIAAAVAAQTMSVACTSQSAPPQQQIDVVGIKSELLAIGQAERQYFVTHSTYATLDELEQDKLLTGGANRRGYVFTVQVDGSQGFTATASPQDADKQNWPTLSMDQTMQVSQQ
jgi:opacity protein-like surface antigen